MNNQAELKVDNSVIIETQTSQWDFGENCTQGKCCFIFQQLKQLKIQQYIYVLFVIPRLSNTYLTSLQDPYRGTHLGLICRKINPYRIVLPQERKNRNDLNLILDFIWDTGAHTSICFGGFVTFLKMVLTVFFLLLTLLGIFYTYNVAQVAYCCYFQKRSYNNLFASAAVTLLKK